MKLRDIRQNKSARERQIAGYEVARSSSIVGPHVMSAALQSDTELVHCLSTQHMLGLRSN